MSRIFYNFVLSITKPMVFKKQEGCDSNRSVRFTKMHGAGNDYIYLNGFENVPEDLPQLAREVSDPHFGIGSDGLVVILPSAVADFRMRMFNADGSEAEMCGNASRCIARYCYERGLTDKTEFTLETIAGIKKLKINLADNHVTGVAVDMGTPELRPDLIPVRSRDARVKLNESENFNGLVYSITAVSMGNPHAVVFVDDITDAMVLEHGPRMEVAEIFPRKANIEFAQVLDNAHIRMRVWERGTGETLACGTGACATAVAAVINGLTDRNVDIILRGGTLSIFWDPESGHVIMSGPAEFICDGTFYRPVNNCCCVKNEN